MIDLRPFPLAGEGGVRVRRAGLDPCLVGTRRFEDELD
jgi:hypothetical protein